MIFDKVLEIYQKYYICIACLGRMFSLLGSQTTNLERGYSLLLSLTMENHRKFLSNDETEQKKALESLKLLAQNANFIPAQKVLQNEGFEYERNNLTSNCYLCHNIFSNIEEIINKTKKKLKEIEFDTFLVGTRPHAEIINQEDKFKTEFNILEAESFKSHFNRALGKKLMISIEKSPEFSNPDVLIIYSLSFDSFEVELNLKSLFIFGKYNKLIRGIPQTHWNCKNCMGNGCKLCNFTGKQYSMSVEELITPEFLKETKTSDSKFHGAGREDIDVRMLGTGRPFILELRNPKMRNLDLVKIEKKINKKNKKRIRVNDLRYSNKKEVILLKAESINIRKIYRALVNSQVKLSKELFEEKVNELKQTFENQEIKQRTPFRVSHRRSDKIREKFVFKIEGKYLKSNLFEFTVETQGGTYIKELINGDNGRTFPSFAEIFKTELLCKELDVLQILL
ncbi:MAG: tRNA pseudouridine(54/55) synthase Pus10 [Promethearchaeota archaeon]